MFKKKILIVLLIALYTLTGTLNADEYANTSYYVAYDKDDVKQYVLVLPSVQKAYTHEAGHIAGTDLKAVDQQFESFPTYNDGNLCFSALKSAATGENGASVMAEKCYEVKFFYTQKEIITDGVAFILFYAPADKVYEGLAGDAESFEVVREGSVVHNENSITGDDYTNFAFNVKTGTVEGVVDEGSNTTLTSGLIVGKTFYIFDGDVATLSFTASTMTWTALFSNDGATPTYTIANNEIIFQGDEGEEHITFVREESSKLLFEVDGKSMVLYKTLTAFQTYLETLVPSNGIKTDPDNDSVNSNVSNDGFELTSLKTEIVNNTLVIEVKAKSSILNAIKTTPRANFDNILWVTISNDYEYGLLADGHYMTKDHWNENHEWQDGTNVAGYTSEILSDGMKVTLPLSALSQEIKDLGYINIKVETADDQHSAPNGDESEDEEHIFDTIESVVKIPTSTGETKSIVGSWYMGDASKTDDIVVLTFFANGSYVFLQDGIVPDGDCLVEDCHDGMERGSYSWDSKTGAFSINALNDTNGEWGFSHLTDTLTVSVAGDTLTMAEDSDTFSFKRVQYVQNSIVGSWYMGDASKTDDIVVLTFFSNGSYSFLQDGVTPDGDCSAQDCHDGIERGTYTWDSANGAFNVNVVTNTDGEWGFSDSPSLTVTVNNNVLTMKEGSDTYTANRVMTDINVASSEIGVWQHVVASTGEFEYLVLLDNGKFIYAENDPAYSEPDNGVEVGSYTYDASKNTISFSIVYDDNAPGDDSGIGNIGTVSEISVSVAGTTMTFFDTPFSKVL